MTQNVSVPYQLPVTISGTVAITKVPSPLVLQNLEALLRPSFAPYTGGAASIACVHAYGTSTGPDSASYKVATLPPAVWNG